MLRKGLTFGSVQMLAVLYIVVWTISPPLEIDLIYRIIAFGCAVIWAGIWIIRENPIILGKEQVAALFFAFAVVLVVFWQTKELSEVIKQISFFMFAICFLMNHFYRDKWEELSAIVPVVMILLIIWNFRTSNALIQDPTIARLIVRDDESTYEFLRQGIGGYSLIYPQVCISPLMLAWTMKSFRNDRLKFIIGLLWVISFAMTVSKAGYSLAIFASVAGVVILLLYKGKSALSAFFVAFTIFVAAMLLILYSDGFRNFLLELFDGTTVTKKINDLVATSDSGEAEGSILVRIEAYMASVDTIIRYPVIGALWKDSGGGHSAILDVMAKYGIWGVAVYGGMIYSVPNYYKKHYSNKFIISTANATLVSLLIISLLDSFTYSFSCMILIVAPLLFEEIINWTGAKKNESIMDR